MNMNLLVSKKRPSPTRCWKIPTNVTSVGPYIPDWLPKELNWEPYKGWFVVERTESDQERGDIGYELWTAEAFSRYFDIIRVEE
jgi:hypothetical protein